ncbi:MAG: sugar phosphate isomerase/epimerase [Christensenellaceae bacterium]|jgi:sugar phosphate isomerase/epimerase|nr:sugar phosphate isomerase/epimerase [Christensenellaceae bacterium]
MDYGLQMYSVRDITKEDLPGALEKVAKLGYTLIEFAGFFGHSAQDVVTMLGKNNVKLSGTHTMITELLNDYEGTLAFHKAIGNKNYIIPSHDLSTKEKLDQFIVDVNRIQPKLAAEGIRLAYHNHAQEFRPNQDGIIVYPELISRSKIHFEIDTFWAFVGEQDPVALMEQLKDRLVFIHIKDGSKEGKGTPLGLGEAPVTAVYAKAKALGVPMVVESETLTPDGLTEAKICIEFLKAQE